MSRWFYAFIVFEMIAFAVIIFMLGVFVGAKMS